MEHATIGYSKTQNAPFHLLLWAMVVGVAILALTRPMAAEVQIVLLGSSALLVVLALSYRYLAVEGRDDSLLVRYGPLPLFSKTIPYERIEKAEVGRTLLIDGWGIHYSMIRRGWVWNLWGRSCVNIHYRDGHLIQVGSDDAENLANFLHGRIGAQLSPSSQTPPPA
jgi:uncharacterized membrane protein YdbT with pleckstrin-like domain